MWFYIPLSTYRRKNQKFKVAFRWKYRVMIKLIIILLFFNNFWNNNFCNIEKQLIEVNWQSMYPILKDGDNITLLKNYYKCNKVKKWDIIAYRYWKKLIVKKIIANDKDNIYFSWNYLIIDRKILKNSQNKKYNFSKKEKNVIKMYLKNKTIPKNSFLIFWENLNNSLDSRKFWAIWKKSIVWKFIIK